jgi:hypothetical protein
VTSSFLGVKLLNLEQFTYQTIEALYNNGCSLIPNEKGVYMLVVPDTFNVEFSDQTTAITEFDGKSLLYQISSLKIKFEKTDKKILYIGKAGGERNRLRQRIRQYIRYGYKEVKNHRGGRAVWQINNCKLLLLGYCPFENPEDKERELLENYFERYGTLPVANWI